MKRRAPADAPPLEAADYRHLAAFRHALRRFLAFSEEAARGAGVTAQQHQALLAVKGCADPGTVSVRYLAEQLMLQPNSMAELVDRMAKAGLLVRTEAPADRRSVILSLTPAAEDVLLALSAAHIRELRDFAPAFDGLLARLKTEPDAGAAEKK